MPQQRGVQARTRLFQHIEESRSANALWISGAPGAGKTTLAAGYLQTNGLRSVWIRLDDADQDCAELFRSFAAACALPAAKSRSLPTFNPEHAPNLHNFARRFFRALFEQLPVPTYVVLDNVDHLRSRPALQALRVALEETPLEVRWLILGRADPPAEFTSLEAAGLLVRLNNEELRFTQDEVRLLMPFRAHQEVDAIHAMTQGWCAGIVLAAAYDRVKRDAPEERSAESREAIFRFFGQEILRAFPPEEQKFLQLAALLPEMSVAQVESLTGVKDAGSKLEHLHRAGLFTSYLRGSPGTYQFHGLMRAFLRREGQLQIPPKELCEARRHAASLMLATGDYPGALDLLTQAGEWELARSAILDSAPLLLRQNRYVTLGGWIEALPPELLQRDGPLLRCLGEVRMRADEQAAYAWFDRAYMAFGAHDPQGQLSCCAGAIAAMQLAEADYRGVRKWAKRLRQLVAILPMPLSARDQVQLTVALATAFVLDAPVVESTTVVEHVQRLLGDFEAHPDAFEEVGMVAAGTAILVFCHTQRERALFDRCERLIAPLLKHHSVSPLFRGRWLVQAGNCHTAFYLLPESTHSLADAAAAYTQARQIAEREQLVSLKAAVLMAETMLSLVLRDREAFAALVPEMGKLVHATTPLFTKNYFLMRCRLHLAQGNFAAALEAAENGRRAAAKANCEGWTLFPLLMLQCCSLAALGRQPEAISIAEQSLTGAKDRFAIVGAAFLHALRAWQAGADRPVYLTQLKLSLQLGAQGGWTLMLEAIPVIAARFFNDALEEGIEPQFVASCIARQQLLPPADAGEQWPWPIRLRVLGPFELHLGNCLATFGPKIPRQPIKLLQAIAASGADGVDSRQAQEWLWADAEAPANSLAIAVHRLRKLCGDGSAIVVREGRLMLDRGRVWTDLQQFELLSEELLQADLSTDSVEGLKAIARSLFKLCRGPLLANEPSEAWLVRARQRYNARFERALHALGSAFEARREWTNALDLYARALEHDDLSEEGYRGQIRCYLELRQPAEAIRVYRRCKELLSIVLAVKPSKQTEALIAECRLLSRVDAD